MNKNKPSFCTLTNAYDGCSLSSIFQMWFILLYSGVESLCSKIEWVLKENMFNGYKNALT